MRRFAALLLFLGAALAFATGTVDQGLNQNGQVAPWLVTIESGDAGNETQVVTGPDGGPVTVQRLLQNRDEVPSCAPPCNVAVCNPDGGAGGFTLLVNLDSTGLRQSGTIVNGASSLQAATNYLELSKDAGVGILTQHPLSLAPMQGYTFDTYSGPWYGCCDADGGCPAVGLVVQ